MGKFTPYSYSKMSTFFSCKRKFKFKYIDKVKIEKCPQEALVKGYCCHLVLEHFPEFPTEELLEVQPEDFRNLGIETAKMFIETDLAKSILNINGLKEYQFGITEEFRPCGYDDTTALFRGSIDRINVLNDNGLHYELIDYKTGKYKDINKQSYDQLSFYAMYMYLKYFNIIPWKSIKIRYIYVEHSKENSLIITYEDFVNILKKFKSQISEIENCIVFSKTENRLCDWCDYQEICQNEFDIAKLEDLEDGFPF